VDGLNPQSHKTQPPADATNFWFVDGEYTDNSAAAHVIACYQQRYGIYSQNLSDILYTLIMPEIKTKFHLASGSSSQGNPQMSKQIFEDER
jgi:hypothetical protein